MGGSAMWRLGTLGAGFMLMLVTGCTDSHRQGPSEPEDLASYGCAMVTDLQSGGSVESWDLGAGLDADAEYATAATAVGILGGWSGTPLSGYEALYQSTEALTAGLQQQDTASIRTGLDNLAAACAEESLPSGDVDTSIEGRIAFACTLAGEIHDAEIFTTDWTQTGVTSSDADRLLITKAYGSASLLGAITVSPLDGHSDLSEASEELLVGLIRADAARTTDELDEINALCGEQ